MKTKQLLLCALFAALTAVGSIVKIPIGTMLVLTFQTFFMFMAGMMLKPRYALFSQVVYAAIGLIGIPVFSTGGGIGYILSPTFGYIIGFIMCAPLISLLVRKNLLLYIDSEDDKGLRAAKIAFFALVSIIVMYIFGTTYMYMIYNYYLGKSLTLGYVIASSTGIFIVVDIIKFALAVPLCAAILRRMPRSLIG